MTTPLLVPLYFPIRPPAHAAAGAAGTRPQVGTDHATKAHTYPPRGISLSSEIAATREHFGVFLVLTDREDASGSTVHPNVLRLLEHFARYAAIYQMTIPRRHPATSPFATVQERWSSRIAVCEQYAILHATIFATGPAIAEEAIDLAYAYPAFVERLIAIVPNAQTFHQQITVKHRGAVLYPRMNKLARADYLFLPDSTGAGQARLCSLYVPEVDVTTVDDLGSAPNKLALFLAATNQHAWQGPEPFAH